MSKGRNIIAGISLIFALAGIGLGVFSYITLNNYINETNTYVLPTARVYYDGPTYSIPHGGALTTFNYNQKTYDSHGAFNLLLDFYRIPETGIYHVIAQYSIESAGGSFRIELHSNNVLVSSRQSISSSASTSFGVALADILNFTSGDTISIKVFQFDPLTQPRDIFNGEEYNFFSIAKVA